jgi:hypothetical protein
VEIDVSGSQGTGEGGHLRCVLGSCAWPDSDDCVTDQVCWMVERDEPWQRILLDLRPAVRRAVSDVSHANRRPTRRGAE